MCWTFAVLELEVRLATEEEEKKLLQVRLDELREQARLQQDQLRNELEKVRTLDTKCALDDQVVIACLFQWTDKAKKKQDRLVSG